MLNEDLLSEHEKEVAKLKLCIQSLKNTISEFKKYDAERKAYYKQSMIELGQLKSVLEEIEDESTPDKKKIKDLTLRVEKYKSLYDHQCTINRAITENPNPDAIQLQFYKENYLKLKEVVESKNTLISELKKNQKNLIKTISSLVRDKQKQ